MITALAPVLRGSAPLLWPDWLIQALLLEAIARDALGDPGAAGRALERALDPAEPGGVQAEELDCHERFVLTGHARAARAADLR